MKYKSLFIILFVVFNLLDIITTLMYRYKYKYFNESNILSIIGVPLEIIILLKVCVMIWFVYYLVVVYNKIEHPAMNYVVIYFIVLLLFMNIGVVINNTQLLQTPLDQEIDIPDDIKIEYYKDQVGDLEIVKPTNTPLLVIIFIINMVQFYTWRNFEKWKKSRSI